ncbi:MAG: DUF1893 domain-containing protein [Tissierellia bacterium]|nr:DUF1893 domain-containing protein [Tissierellia bacterium]
MKDIEIAKNIFQKEDMAIVVVKNGVVVFKSKDRGIKPIYRLAKEMKEEAHGASIVDKVIGKGAALLCGYLGIKEVHGVLMSKEGQTILDRYKIPYTMDISCPYIMNRDKTDYCPIEKLSLDIEDPEIFLSRVEEFFTSIRNME